MVTLTPGLSRLTLTLKTWIRTVAVTPRKSKTMDFEDVRRICQDYTLIGLRAMFEARTNNTTPFRFLYASGVAAERDQTKTPTFMPQYSLMRVRISAYIHESKLILLHCIGRDRKPSPCLCRWPQRSNRGLRGKAWFDHRNRGVSEIGLCYGPQLGRCGAQHLRHRSCCGYSRSGHDGIWERASDEWWSGKDWT